MKVALLGVRGSTPTPGHDFAGYGGHTSCVALYADGEDRPRLILDAGTGLRSLPTLLGGAPFAGDIVLSHLHWDHVQGLPFCPSVDQPEAEVRLHVPVPSGEVDPVTLLARSMSPPHFPIGPEGLRGHWRFSPLVTGAPDLPAGVTVAVVEHKGGVAYGIRVELDAVTLAYLPDHALTGDPARPTGNARALARGADLLLHDGQFSADELAAARDYGHATVEATAEFADECGVGELILTHHAPGRTDGELDRLAAAMRSTVGGIPVRFARQDSIVDVRPRE